MSWLGRSGQSKSVRRRLAIEPSINPGKRQLSQGKRRPLRRPGARLAFIEALEPRLVLAPVLSYSTYLGGNKNDSVEDVAVDSVGNTYVVGSSRSPNLPGASGADTRFLYRAFLTKFTPTGEIAYSTILGPTPRYDEGGYSESKGWNVDVGPDDLPVVNFETREGPTINLGEGLLLPAPAPHFMHVAKLSDVGLKLFDAIAPVPDRPERGILNYTLFFTAVNMVLDDGGAAYVTYSSVAAGQAAIGDGIPSTSVDPFLTKVAPDGSVIFTKSLFVIPNDIAVDHEHNIYLVTTETRDDLPVSAGALQATGGVQPSNLYDGYVAKLDPTASALLAATYFGGNRWDLLNALAVDPNRPGIVYLAGATSSPDFPVVPDAYQQQLNTGIRGPSLFRIDGGIDGFVAVLNLNLTPIDGPDSELKMKLIASTLVGGGGEDGFGDLTLDDAGNVYVSGSTGSLDYPVANPLQAVLADGPQIENLGYPRDIVISKFDAILQTLEFSSYFGGTGHEGGTSLSVDRNGTIHLGATSSGQHLSRNQVGTFDTFSTSDFPVKAAAQANFAGGDFGDGNPYLATDGVVVAISQRGTLVGRGIQATVGREFTYVVGEFDSPRRQASPGDFTVQIDWGDGTNSVGFVTHPTAASPQFFVHGTHQYDKPGAYPVIVHVQDRVAAELSPVTNIDVSRSAQNQIAGAIAVDPGDPTRLFAAMTDERGQSNTGGILVATSDDSGESWSPRLVGVAADMVLPSARSNPDVVFDDFGNLFLAYQGSEGNNIVVAWSTDGGDTFNAENMQELTPAGSTGDTGMSVVGSPKLAFSLNHEIWVTFEDVANNTILAAGAGVGGLGEVGSFNLRTVNGSAGGAFSDIAVGPEGAVAVAWQTVPPDGGTAKLLSSIDLDGLGSADFSAPTVVDTSTTDGELKPDAQQNSVPLGATLAWDTSAGPHAGRLYVAYVDMANDSVSGTSELTLFVAFADGLADNWDTPRRVTLDASFQSMFLPSLAIDPVTGTLAVGWYGTRGTVGQVQTSADFFIATSRDGKEFSEAQRVSTDSSDALDPKLSPFGAEQGYGEAPGMAFLNGRLYPMWSDNSALNGDNYTVPQFETVTSIVGVVTVKVPPVAIRPIPIQAVKGETFNGAVASFTHPDGGLQAGNFSATIHWGDGAQSLGQITRPGGPGTKFLVSGSHAYAEAGAYPLWVEVHDDLNNVDAQAVSNVNAQQGSQAEATIAIDPSNPERVFAAGVHANIQAPRGIPVAASEDGGVTWVSDTIADGTDSLPPSIGDPKVVFDQFGNLFLTYLTPAPEKHIVVLLSTNGGHDFTLLATFTDVDKADQPSIAVGPGAEGAGGSVWLTWERGNSPFQIIMVASAPVFGLGGVGGFGQRLVAPLSADGLGRNFGDIAVGPNGQVLVAYVKGVPDGSLIGPAEIVVHLDPDGLGSAPFGPPVLVTDVEVGNFLPIPAQATRTIDTEGNLAWDRSDGEHRGRVYLVYTDSPGVGNVDTNIFLRYSDSQGVTWSEPIQVHDDDALSQFLPSVAVDQSTGNVGVGWHTAVEATNVRTRFTATLSDDGGSFFRLPRLVSPGESDATDESLDDGGERFQYGDYTGLAFVNGVLQPIWADNSVELDAIPDPRRFDLASARIAVAEVLQAPLVVQPFGVDDVEGREFTVRVATFRDPGSPRPASDYRATINWGDGTQPTQGTIQQEPDGSFTVLGKHEYTKLGRYPVSVMITGHRTKGEGTATAVIADAPLTISLTPGLRVVRESEFTKVVGTFTDLNHNSVASDFIATIEWGDGGGGGSTVTLELQPGSGQQGAPNTFTITGKYKYLSEKTFSINVSIRDKPAEKTHDQQGNLVSGDPPLVAKPGKFFNALEGLNSGDRILVKFERASGIEVPLDASPSEYTTTINWGDGQVDTDVTPFVTSTDVTVVGRHTYMTAGEFYPSVTVEDDSDGSFSAPLIALVEPDVTPQVRTVSSGLVYNPLTNKFVGELSITNTSDDDISGPLYVVIHDLPEGVSLDSFTTVDGDGNPIYKVNQSRLSAGASLPPIPLEFSNPSRVPISYTVQVFDGIKPQVVTGDGLIFEPNQGQAGDSVSYIAMGSTYAIGLAADHAALVLRGDGSSAGAAAFMEWVGSNSSPTALPLDPLPGVSNYLLGESSVTGVPHYGSVRYASVYDGIDLEYYGREGVLEYDWIVRPGADVSDIAMRFHGVNQLLTDSAGNLRLQMAHGELVQRAPVAYQFIDGQRQEVTAGFALQTDGTVTFATGAYDHSLPLVIDPVLVYSTYFGGSTFGEQPRAVAVDSQGNSYITGLTLSADFPTVNAFDDDLNDQTVLQSFIDYDAFIIKLDPSGVPIFSTYLGGSMGPPPPFGSSGTFGQAIAVDNAGHIFVGGDTTSPTFPALNPAPSPFSASSSVFIGSFLTELSADGSAILYSTVLKEYTSQILDLAIDREGHVYATGLYGAFKLDPVTNTTAYSFAGGSIGFGGANIGKGIAVDDFGQAYVAGFTTSSRFKTKNALFPELHNPQPKEPDNFSDGFVMKLSSAGDVLFATYLGGRFSDAGTDIAVDDSGVIYVAGVTDSDDLPVPNGLDTTLGGAQDGFLIKLANDGSAVLYGTYIGGSYDGDVVNGVGVDAQGRTYLAGTTDSTDLPTVQAHQPTGGSAIFGFSDGFAASIAADGRSFEYLTYLGGSDFDELVGVAVDRLGNATYVGRTYSSDFPTRNAWQQHLGSGFVVSNTVVVRLLAGDAGTITLHNAPITVVEGNAFNGLVAFFESNGTETADQFSAVIDWGDGLTSAGTIAGEFRTGFQAFGSHLYAEDLGTHDVFVTLRDSLGRSVTVKNTTIVAAAAEGRAHYRVAIDTAALAGAEGLLSFQFNPGALPGSPDATARITEFGVVGGALGGSTTGGDVSGALASQLMIRPTTVLNRLSSNVTLGSHIEFDVEFSGPGLTSPSPGAFADVFAVQLLDAAGAAQLLSADGTGSLLRIILLPDGSTRALSAASAVRAAAAGLATVANGPLTVTIAPFEVQEGLPYNGPVATLTNGNPLESAEEFTALIDWGDGSPVTPGIVSGSSGNFTVAGLHAYKTVGSYALAVTVQEPDGLQVESASTRAILAALPFKNDWGSLQYPPDSRPVSGDFNGDGILDIAVGGFLPTPSSPSRGVAILLGRGDGSFTLAGFQTTGQSAIELAVADFNDDGKLDVAAAIWNRSAAPVELLLGNGDGTLQPSIQLMELTNPGNIAAADLNGDGDVDLIYTESFEPSQHTASFTLKIALGHGNGTFATPTSTTIPSGFNIHASTADMDHDGKLDIILASFSSLQFLHGMGNGAFAEPIQFGTGRFSANFSSSFAIGDFDGDGHQDVAATDGNNLNIFSGGGDGTFAEPLLLAAFPSSSVASGDFNGDGRPDLATSEIAFNDFGRVRVYINNSAGGFAGGVAYEGISAPSGIVAGDFDRDGHLDLALFGTTTVISVLPGIGDGTFASAVRYESGFVGAPLDITPRGVVAADVNGDGDADAVLIASSGQIVTEIGNGDGTFQSIVSGKATLGGAGLLLAPILADIDNDGVLDLISCQGSGIGVVLGRGDGTFPTMEATYSPAAGPSAVSLADFNQDGRLDIAVASAQTFANLDVSVLLAKGDGTFQPAAYYTTGIGARTIALGDINADSRTDLVVANESGSVSVLLGNANGTFASAINIVVGTFPFNNGIRAEAARVGDFNGDGKLDIVVVGYSGSGLVLPGNGNGTFGASIPFATNITSRDVAVGDFNADGKLDIVTAEEAGEHFSAREFVGGLSVLLGNGNGTFQAAIDYFAGTNPTTLTLGDFNQDGRPDIATANRNINGANSGNASILLGNANGTFQTAVNYTTTGSHPRGITAGDLNADGKLDLAVANASGDTAILLGNGNGTFQPSLNYSAGSNIVAGADAFGIAIGDLNGDGRADLVSSTSLLFGTGDGAFPNNRLFTYLPPVEFQTSNPEDIAAGDLNGDGNVDLAVSMRGTTVVLIGNGNGSFLLPTRLTPPGAAGLGERSNRVSIVDMDGDGDLDVVSLHQSLGQTGGGVAVWRNNGSGAFGTPLVRLVPMAKYDFSETGVDLEVGDLNGDGHVDVVVVDSGSDSANGTDTGGASVMLGVGDGSLTQPVRYVLPPRQRAYRVTFADLNGDSRPEIVALTSPFGFGVDRSAVAVFTNNGDGSFGAAQLYDHGGTFASYLATGDFNGDDLPDILVPHSESVGSGVSSTFSIIFAGTQPVLVRDAPVTVTGVNLNPRAGAAFTATVATFIDDNPFGEAVDFTATINWGDGQTSPGSIRIRALGGFEVTGSHTYAAEGVFTTMVTVLEIGEGTHVGTATARVSNTDQALAATGLIFNPMAEVSFTGVVATFTDADVNGSAGDFSALIRWGDGQTSSGVIAASVGGGFSVSGTHTYANPGTLPVQTDITDIGGSTATANSTAQVAPHANRPPLAANDTYSTNEDTTLIVLAANGVLVNDSDVDSAILRAVVIALPTQGALSLADDGSFTYRPKADFFGSDHFTYKSSDGSAESNVATVSITVRPVNDAPVAKNDDDNVTDEDTPIVIDVLANDTDIDDAMNPATVVFTSQPIHGTVAADADTGSITYTPVANFFGSDSLRYKVRDTNGLLSNEAVVMITINGVNDAPVAIKNHYVTGEDTTLTIGAADGVLANDADIERNLLEVSTFTTPAHGTLILNSDGSFSYDPDPEFSGSDSFLYRAFDGTSESGLATVYLIILALNDEPVVSPLADRVINEGDPFTSSGAFSDPDSDDAWTATVDYGDGTGTQPLLLDGTNFNLNHNYPDSGQYTATVKIVDRGGQMGSESFQVTVQNLAPIVQAGADKVASEGALVSILAAFTDLAVLDTHTATIDWGDGTPMQFVSVTESAGTGTIASSHVYADEGAYVVTVTVTDDEGAAASDTITVTVQNIAPLVEAGSDRTIAVGQPVALPALQITEILASSFGAFTFQSLAGSFIDPGARDSHTAAIDWGDGTVETTPLVERAVGPPSSPTGIAGVVAITHRYTETGIFRVFISVTDDDGGLGSDSFMIDVTAEPNQAPVITSNGGGSTTTVNVPENSTAVTTLAATDPDAEATLTYSIIGGADAAKFTLDPLTHALQFKVAPDYEAPTNAGANNVYEVTVQVSDGDLFDTQDIAVTVTDVNPWHNFAKPLDVRGGNSVGPDDHIDPGDALAIINYINAFDSGRVDEHAAIGLPFGFLDVTNDENVAPDDALTIINHINSFDPDGEGESTRSQDESSCSTGPDIQPISPSGPFSLQELIALLAMDVASQPRRRR